jgi:hypothetical protein
MSESNRDRDATRGEAPVAVPLDARRLALIDEQGESAAFRMAFADVFGIGPVPGEHVHTRDCYDDPGPGHGSPSLICDHGGRSE